MGHIIRRILAVGFVLGFGVGGLLWVLGDPATGQALLLLGAIFGVAWSFLGAMMSPFRIFLNIIWIVVFGYMIARSTVWKDIQPDSPETNMMFRILDFYWEYLRLYVIVYVILYALTWGQSIMFTQVQRARYPVYPTFAYEQEQPVAATGETIAQPAVEEPPVRENLMQRRGRHLKIRRLWEQDRDNEAVALLRPGENIVDGDVVSVYD